MQALADGPLGALGKVSPKKEIEELRLRLVREADENFHEAEKLRGICPTPPFDGMASGYLTGGNVRGVSEIGVT